MHTANSIGLRLLSFVLVVAAVACGGGSTSSSTAQGADSPEAAVHSFIDSLAKGNSDAALAVTDPNFRDHGVEGLSASQIIQTAATYQKRATFSNLSFQTAAELDSNYARVHVFGRVKIDNLETAINDQVAYTASTDGRWYVTSEGSPYWSATLAKEEEAAASGNDKAELDDSPNLPGVYIPPHPGPDGQLGTSDDRVHSADPNLVIPICTPEQIAQNQISNPVCYTSNPPTSGPHSPNYPRLGFYSEPIAKEMLVHSMEHGSVVIWYNTTDASIIAMIQLLTNGANGSNMLVIASPYDGMEPETIALTSWTRLDKFPVSDFSQQRLLTFIQAHSRRFNPEGF